MLFDKNIKYTPLLGHFVKKKRIKITSFSFKQWLLFSILFTIISFFLLSYYIPSSFHSLMRIPPKPKFKCYSQRGNDTLIHFERLIFNNHVTSAELRFDPKVLLFVESQYSKLGKEMSEILESSRMKHKLEIAGKSLPILTNMDKGKFAVIIFENFERYLLMSNWNKQLLDKYCREYGVGIIGFMSQKDERNANKLQLKGLPLYIDTNLAIKDYRLNPSSSILRLARAGEIHFGKIPGKDWVAFYSNHTSYQPLGQAFNQSDNEYNQNNFTTKKQLLTTVIQDHGLYDGIQRVIFGNGFNFWIHKLLLLDSISYLSSGKLSLPLKRYILIDIDDIFVGETGTRMKSYDVMELIESQKRFQQLIPGFRFNLGFSGKYYNKGDYLEDRGDDLLIENAKDFWWFCHMFSHTQPHLYDNITILENEMKMNQEFAEKYNIPVNYNYSVAPHHSGVYPVHEPLYEAWKKIWDLKVTSTEEYPHLRPARLRRGFKHKGIMVLPRQTCGLYTHTIFIDKYPGGREKLENSIMGGELFYSFVYNPINVFMTHMSNYGNDRLALYTFESVISFVQCWTNLEIFSLPPLQLANKYFEMFPEENDPIWMNPCNDKRHQAIWSSKKSCDQMPKFLVIGPQKTGTTALYTFLSMHSSIVSNLPSSETFEEIQFFNGKNYYNGLDWYMNFFPALNTSSGNYLFEKSATYFDGELVPMRVHSLLPNAKLITILISPIKRAYSWYHHILAHKEMQELNFTFYDVITADDTSPKQLRDLKNRCLNPGLYAQHLERWLSYFPPQQLLILDGEELKSDPMSTMDKVQHFLKIEPYYNYSEHLRFDLKKGFFCQITQLNATKCLGKSKGRKYPSMDLRVEKYLRQYYLPQNVALSKLFVKLRLTIPSWLEDDLSHEY